jgi:1-acyl-sn-glycerol-3-phosphate acyltransferase
MTDNVSRPATAPQAVPPGPVKSAAYALYGVYAWASFSVCAVLTLVVVLAVPGLDRRRRVAHGVARNYLRIAGLPMHVSGLEHLPAGPCVVVANHASYLDGVIMKAVLPPRFAYVVKREMDSFPLAGLLLRRIGTEFVERFNRHKGASDARRVLRTASSGQALVFFPEGTFTNVAGLGRFHSGAFATAVRAGCPVVPAVIRGSRAILPGSRLLPRPGRIQVELLAPLQPQAIDGENAAHALRADSRRMILERLGEPDLDGADED